MKITSLQNSRVKHVVRLNNRRYRDTHRQTIVEGLAEMSRALKAGITPQEAYLCPELIVENEAGRVLAKLRQLESEGLTAIFEVTAAVYAKIAYRGNSGGILLVIAYQEHTPDIFLGVESPFLAVVDSAEKPGNIGAILRTADAAGVNGLIISESSDSGTDIHNPNVIRASLGALFSVPVISMPALGVREWLARSGLTIVATSPQASDLYTAVPLQGPLAVVMGSEAYGLDQAWLAAADLLVRIPMFGVVDSLNLSVSTALILYEVVRQRKMSDKID